MMGGNGWVAAHCKASSSSACPLGPGASVQLGTGAGWSLGVGGVLGRGPAQPASTMTVASTTHAHPEPRMVCMTLLLLEALGALLILVGIVWWTMFSGRPGGERPADEDENSDQKDDSR